VLEASHLCEARKMDEELGWDRDWDDYNDDWGDEDYDFDEGD